MARTGRPPKPTVLKLIEGNRGHRPISTDEPRPEVQIPSCPRHVKGEARKEWRRIAVELKGLGLLTRIDRGRHWRVIVWLGGAGLRPKDTLRTEGPVIEGSQKNLVKSPWVRIAMDCLEQIRRFGSEFGLTPSSRGRLHVPGVTERSLSEIAAERAEANRKKTGA